MGALGAMALSGPGSLQAAAPAKPMLMEGKETLFQRVIILTKAFGKPRLDSPRGDAIVVPPFAVWYVYQIVEENGRTYFLCGPSTKGGDLLWFDQDMVAIWDHSVVLTFAEKAGRPPLLFFKESALDDYLDIANNPGVKDKLAALAERFVRYRDNGEVPPSDYPILAMEPTDAEGAVPKDRFYIMPIFEIDEGNGLEDTVKFLRVGSIDPGVEDQVGSSLLAAPAAEDEPAIPRKIGLAFVIDTTMSMGPYIEATRSIANSIFDLAQKNDNVDNLYLAVVAFRSSLEAHPERAAELEYTTKVISDFVSADDRVAFDLALSRVKEAPVSTHSFSEDSFAGINAALTELNWPDKSVGGAIVLITDAGPLAKGDPYRSTELPAHSVLEIAGKQGVAIIAIHLKTPAGAANHAHARTEYSALAFAAGGKTGYLPLDIPNPDDGPAAFTRKIQTFAESLDRAFRPKEGDANPQDNDGNKGEIVEPPAETGDDAADIGNLLGYSIRLNYLGRENKTTAPLVVNSWIADKELGFLDSDYPQDVRTVDVNVLLTRAQLSVLMETVRFLLEQAQTDLLAEESGTRNFFDSLLATASSFMRDPATFTGENELSEYLLAAEFLDGLPYKSEIMTLTRDRWGKMPTTAKEIFISDLHGKLRAYERFDRDTNNWGKFATDNLDHLYRVPLSELP